mgnify:FL=1|tara:strand:- start:296 stop:454 length:159 start_codon:yes stop_codon:yes gene_type:complete
MKQQMEINKDTLDMIKKLFNLIKQQREYNLLQDQQVESLQNRIKKLEESKDK